MKKFLLEKDIELKSDESENDEKIEFEIVNTNEKKRSFKIPLIVVSILLVLSFTLNLYQLGINNQNDQKLEKTSEEKRKLEQEVKQDREKLDFLDEYIVMVEDDNTDLYHKYEC